MRKFIVWARCSCAGGEVTVKMPDSATDNECEQACSDMLNEIIGSKFDTGWDELDKKVTVGYDANGSPVE